MGQGARGWRPLDRGDLLRGAAVLAAFVAAVVVVAAVVLARVPFVGVLVLAGMLLVLVRWHARTTAYVCGSCGEVFEQRWFEDLVSPHAVRRQRVRCPRCRTVAWREGGRRS